MVIVSRLAGGKILARGTASKVVASGAADITVTIGDLRVVEYVINVQFSTNPKTTVYGPHDKWIEENNVVGISITDVAAGTTLTGTVDAVGY